MIFGGRAARMLIIALAALVPYLHTLGYGYVYDDAPIIAERAELHAPSGLARAWAMPYWPESAQEGAGLYRPVAQFAYSALWLVGGGSPVVFHLYAVLLHVAASLLLLMLLSRLVTPAAALGGALLFAVHPVHVEAVANIVGSAEVLVAVCGLWYGTLLLRAAEKSAIGWRDASVLAGVYALALGAKESGVVVPVVGALVLWAARGDWTIVRRAWRVWAASGIAFVALTGARWAVLGTLAVDPEAVAIGIKGVSASTRVWTMLGAFPVIGQLLLWPTRLVMHYGHSIIRPYEGASAGASMSLAVIASLGIASVVLARRGDRLPVVALAWIGATFLPASNLLVPTGQLLAERTLYLPSVGIALLVAWAIARLAERLKQSESRARLAAIPLLIVAVLGAVRTATGAAAWKDNHTLFTTGIAADPESYRPYLSLASWSLRQGRRDDAMALFARAYALYPRDPKLALNYGRELLAQGQSERALEVLRQGLPDAPRSTLLRVQYLSALLTARGPDSLIHDVRAHAAPDPAASALPLFLARAFDMKGEVDSAAAVLGAASRAAPGDGSLVFLHAMALHRARRDSAASRQLDRADALAQAPLVARAYLRAEVSLALGDTTRARTAIAAAKQAAPTDTAVLRLERALQ